MATGPKVNRESRCECVCVSGVAGSPSGQNLTAMNPPSLKLSGLFIMSGYADKHCIFEGREMHLQEKLWSKYTGCSSTNVVNPRSKPMLFHFRRPLCSWSSFISVYRYACTDLAYCPPFLTYSLCLGSVLPLPASLNITHIS